MVYIFFAYYSHKGGQAHESSYHMLNHEPTRQDEDHNIIGIFISRVSARKRRR